MAKNDEARDERTELYEREMKHDEHRETPLDSAGRETHETARRIEERRQERKREEAAEAGD